MARIVEEIRRDGLDRARSQETEAPAADVRHVRGRVGGTPGDRGRTAGEGSWRPPVKPSFAGGWASTARFRRGADRSHHDRKMSIATASRRSGRGGLGASSINKTISMLAAILETAVDMSCWTSIPRRDAGGVWPSRCQRDRSSLAPITFGRSWTPPGRWTWRLGLSQGQRRAVIATLIFAGVRIGEARRLRWDDVDLVNGAMTSVRPRPLPGSDHQHAPDPASRAEMFRPRRDSPDGLLFHDQSGTADRRQQCSPAVLAPAVTRADMALRQSGLPRYRRG